ncbi:MAG: hypothetical protein GYA34_17525 [Chloroflexi bacterium]|nr:hypothetical protein [Chloroflexota bacterium]
MKKRLFIIALVLTIFTGTLVLYNGVGAKATNPAKNNSPSELKTQADALEDMQTLKNIALQQISKPEWVHFVTRASINPEEVKGKTYPDQRPIPPVTIHESWYHLDENNQVFEDVQFTLTEDGEIIQEGVTRDNLAWNITYDIEFPIEPSDFVYDFEFERTVNESIGEGATLTEIETVFNDKPSRRFDLLLQFGEPQKLDTYSKAESGMLKRYYVDPETGFVTRLEMIVQFADGTEQISSVQELITLEAADPGEEILAYLQKEKAK